jgi:NADP-dependent aldehyde dehydrogenase
MDTTFHSLNARTGEPLPGTFRDATAAEIDAALGTAAAVAKAYRETPAETRIAFLERMAAGAEAAAEELIALADAETALGRPRLPAELGRACAGARMFAAMLREGSWVDARIDTANPARQPVPKPDLRMMHRPIGPVVVFGASNFPFAISVMGTDTVSALAVGCPVVVKAHPAHPHTCERMAAVIRDAARECGLPEGVFTLLQGRGHEVGAALVTHPKTEAVAFTGSLRGGRALFDLAARRERPIPVYAEMGSLNPVFLLPGALAQRGARIAEGFVASLTLGTGQFCTNPAMVLALDGPDLDAFLAEAGSRVAAVKPGSMLHRGIHQAYCEGVERIEALGGVRVRARGEGADPARAEAAAVLFEAAGEAYFRHPEILREEVFGPSSVVLRCGSAAELTRFAEAMDGSLSATIHGTEEDLAAHRDLFSALQAKVGRLIVNGFPTGLEVCAAMHHGGPYPATTHSHFTSVGLNSYLRFVRPVSYQDVPDAFLPEELQNANPRGLWRLVDGEKTKGAVA